VEYLISDADRLILREVAKKQLEMANQPSNQARIQQWYRHNALQGKRPWSIWSCGPSPRKFCLSA